MLCLFLTACDGSSWNSAQVYRNLRIWRDAVQQMEAELETLPEARVVAQAHQRLGFHGRSGNPAWIMLDLGRFVMPEEILLLSARVSDPAPDDPVGGFPPVVRCSLSATGIEDSFWFVAGYREEYEGAGSDLPLLSLHYQGKPGRYLRIEVEGGRARSHGQFFTLGEIIVLENGINRALGAEVTTSPSIENAPRWTASNLTDGYLWCGSLTGLQKSPLNGFHSAIETTPEAVPKWVEVDLGDTFPLDEIRLVPARPPDYADIAGFGFPPSFQVIASAGENDEGQVLFEGVLPNPGDATVCLPGHGVSARRVRVKATSLWQRSQDYVFALAELQVMSQGLNAAIGKPVRASDVATSSKWSLPALVDGFSSRRELIGWSDWVHAVKRRRWLESALASARPHLIVLERGFHESLLWNGVGVIVSLFLLGALSLSGVHLHQQRERARLRQRIAQDLHDEMGSQLSHLALLAETGQRSSGDSLAAIANEARDLQHTLRDLVWLLEPHNADPRDFAARLRITCRRLLAPMIPDVQIDSSGEPPPARLPLEWTRDLLLFVKEALSNCARHSQATSARLCMNWTDKTFEWQLMDDGIGFDETASEFEPGAGLRNLRLRATALHAVYSLVSKPGEGTQIRLQVPLPRPRRYFAFNRS